jgi:hypothetical protein
LEKEASALIGGAANKINIEPGVARVGAPLSGRRPKSNCITA